MKWSTPPRRAFSPETRASNRDLAVRRRPSRSVTASTPAPPPDQNGHSHRNGAVYMPFIIGISGSLRRDSFNTGLLRAASSLMPDTVSLEIADIRSIPLYNGDIEQSDGIPEAV